MTVDAVQFLPADETLAEPAVKKESSTASKLKQRLAALEKELKELQKGQPDRPEAMSVADDSVPEDAKIHIRGSIRNLGASVPRGFIQAALHGKAPGILLRPAVGWNWRNGSPPVRIPSRRASWSIVSGTGSLARASSAPPTILAPLASRRAIPSCWDPSRPQFIEDGWSLKHLVKQMVMSRTYRMSSSAPMLSEDPDNRLLSHMNRKRLDAECLRDAMLTAAGTLDREFCGPGVSEVKAVDANDQKIQNIEYGLPVPRHPPQPLHRRLP